MGDASEGRPSGKGKPLNSIEHKTSKSTKAWIKKELAQQQKRFKQPFSHLEESHLIFLQMQEHPAILAQDEYQLQQERDYQALLIYCEA